PFVNPLSVGADRPLESDRDRKGHPFPTENVLDFKVLLRALAIGYLSAGEVTVEEEGLGGNVQLAHAPERRGPVRAPGPEFLRRGEVEHHRPERPLDVKLPVVASPTRIEQ